VFLYDGLLSSTRWADRPQGFADPSEYFPETPRPGIAIPPAEAPRKLFAILLASLFAAKVALALLAHRPSSA